MTNLLLIAVLGLGPARPTLGQVQEIDTFEQIGLEEFEGRFMFASGVQRCDGKEGRPPNDEVSSLCLRGIPAGTRIIVYDSPSPDADLRREGDDFTVIDVRRTLDSINISCLETSFLTRDVQVQHRRVNGLNGKVSSIRIIPDYFVP